MEFSIRYGKTDYRGNPDAGLTIDATAVNRDELRKVRTAIDALEHFFEEDKQPKPEPAKPETRSEPIFQQPASIVQPATLTPGPGPGMPLDLSAENPTLGTFEADLADAISPLVPRRAGGDKT